MIKQYRPIALWALLLAPPLLLAGLAASHLFEADHVVSREQARTEAGRAAARLGAATADAVNRSVRPLHDRLAASTKTEEVVQIARTVLYTNQASAVVVRRDAQRLFPPEIDWNLTPGMAAQVKALEAATESEERSPPTAGWLTGVFGPVFFRCELDDKARQICVALDWPHVQKTVLDTLDKAAASFSGWSFRLRDPSGHSAWTTGAPPITKGDAVDLDGPMHGWQIEASATVISERGVRGDLVIALAVAIVWMVLVWSKVRRERDRLAASAARADFIAKLSHDLRTPLANLKLYAELIARHARTGPAGQGKIEDYCRVLTEEIDRLDDLASHTVALGATSRPGRLHEGAPDDVVRTIVARLHTLFEASGCRCEVEGGAATPCRFDHRGLERILVNLLDNARKFAPGQIRVTTSMEREKLRLSVRDWGLGSSMHGSNDGFGLGLSVVRDLAKVNEGRVDVIPCVPGTRVDVTIKVAPAMADQG